MLKITRDNIDTMVQRTNTSKGTPWEGVGHALPRDANLEQTLKLAELNWHVLKRPAWVESYAPAWKQDEDVALSEGTLANGGVKEQPIEPIKVPGNYVLMRDDTMTPISPFVGARYKPIQNEDAFEVFREFCEAGNMTMETAGSLFGGQHIWGLAKIEGDYMLTDGEYISGYFLLMQSHVYGSALKALFTPIRFPGAHMLVQPAYKKNGASTRTYTMSHSRVWNDDRKAEVKEVIGTAQTVLADFVDEARALSQVDVDVEATIRYFVEVFHPTLHKKLKHDQSIVIPDRIEDLRDWEESNRNLKRVPDFLQDFEGANLPTCQGTAWGVVQATNYAFDHVIGNGTDTRLVSSWMGQNAKKKLKALSSAKKLGKV